MRTLTPAEQVLAKTPLRSLPGTLLTAPFGTKTEILRKVHFKFLFWFMIAYNLPAMGLARLIGGLSVLLMITLIILSIFYSRREGLRNMFGGFQGYMPAILFGLELGILATWLRNVPVINFFNTFMTYALLSTSLIAAFRVNKRALLATILYHFAPVGLFVLNIMARFLPIPPKVAQLVFGLMFNPVTLLAFTIGITLFSLILVSRATRQPGRSSRIVLGAPITTISSDTMEDEPALITVADDELAEPVALPAPVALDDATDTDDSTT
jgi:hypothetical protein